MTDCLMSEMVRNQRPLTLNTDAVVAEACRHLDERRVGAVPVTDVDDHLVGIFTGRDAVRMLAQRRATESPLGAMITRLPDVMPPDRTAMDALRLVQDGGFRHVPVVERGRMVDVVSRGDFRASEHDQLDIETGFWERI